MWTQGFQLEYMKITDWETEAQGHFPTLPTPSNCTAWGPRVPEKVSVRAQARTQVSSHSTSSTFQAS